MSDIIKKDSRWRNKRTKRVAVILHASNASDFPSRRSAYGDASDDAYADLAVEQRLADSMVMYRYEKKTGRSVQTMSVKREAFLASFERTK